MRILIGIFTLLILAVVLDFWFFDGSYFQTFSRMLSDSVSDISIQVASTARRMLGGFAGR
jgi:hypothetical protein